MLETLRATITRRRALVITPFAFAGIVAVTSRRGRTSQAQDPNQEVTIIEFTDGGEQKGLARVKPVVHTDAEWKRLLTADQFYVTRRESTDAPFTGTFYKLHAQGLFRCIGCGNALFSSQTKFDSGTGWPSFWAPVAEQNIRTRTDTSMLMERISVSCTLCGGHLGHVFDDGPPPTNLRYCINESSLRFIRNAG